MVSRAYLHALADIANIKEAVVEHFESDKYYKTLLNPRGARSKRPFEHEDDRGLEALMDDEITQVKKARGAIVNVAQVHKDSKSEKKGSDKTHLVGSSVADPQCEKGRKACMASDMCFAMYAQTFRRK